MKENKSIISCLNEVLKQYACYTLCKRVLIDCIILVKRNLQSVPHLPFCFHKDTDELTTLTQIQIMM